MNTTEATTPVEHSATPGGKPPAKWLSQTFNAVAKIGLGAAVGLGVKTAVLTVAATASAPALAIAGIAALAGGLSSLAASVVKHSYENRQLVKAGQDTLRYDWKKKGTLAFGLGALGGGVFSYFSDTISSALGDVFDYFKTPDFATNPLAEIAPSAAPEILPAPAAAMSGPCLADDVQKLVNTDGTSDTVKDAATRACSGNARVAAQGTKDLGFHMLNGVGVEKAPALGVAQLTKAAEAGNIQAIRDMAYLQFHGISGVEKNVEAALEKMETVVKTDKTGLAKRLMDQWTSSAPSAPVSAPSVPAGLSDTEITDRLNIETPIRETVEPLPAPAAEPAPAIKAQPEPATSSLDRPASATAATSGCKAVFTQNEVEFHCPVDDATMVVGERIQITRPPMLVNPAMGVR